MPLGLRGRDEKALQTRRRTDQRTTVERRQSVRRQVQSRLDLDVSDLGSTQLKNIAIGIFRKTNASGPGDTFQSRGNVYAIDVVEESDGDLMGAEVNANAKLNAAVGR